MGKAKSSFHVLCLQGWMSLKQSVRCFASSSAEERQKKVVDAIPKNTKVATEFWIRVFSDYPCSMDKGDVNL